MRSTIRDSIDRIDRAAWDFAAGEDLWIYVNPAGEETELRAIEHTVLSGEGLDVDEAGIRNQEQRVLSFNTAYLMGLGLEEIDPAGHFMFLGERWDLAIDKPIAVRMQPIGGTHGRIRVVVRKAVEVNRSLPGSEFTYL